MEKKNNEMTWEAWMELRRREVERDLNAEPGITPMPLPPIKVK